MAIGQAKDNMSSPGRDSDYPEHPIRTVIYYYYFIAPFSTWANWRRSVQTPFYRNHTQPMPTTTSLQRQLRQVQTAIQNNLLDQAKHLCNAICEKNPDCLDARLLLGQIHMNLGDFGKSAVIYKALFSRVPNDPVLHYKLAYAFKHAGELDPALKHFRQALKLNPGFAEACAGEASILELKGENKQAFRILSRFIRHYGTNPLVTLVYGKLCQQTGIPAKAIPAALKALSSETIDRTNAGLLHFQAGRLYEALEEYEKAFRHFSAGNRLKNLSFDTDAFTKGYRSWST